MFVYVRFIFIFGGFCFKAGFFVCLRGRCTSCLGYFGVVEGLYEDKMRVLVEGEGFWRIEILNVEFG